MYRLETPVALFVFNRPDTTRRVFAEIAAARPMQLLLVADGPRPNRVEDVRRCDEVKRIISAVDWPCRVETNFSDENLGCRRRMISGLNWVFSMVEEAIILEDDCLPSSSFFRYCAELLGRYRNCLQIGIISGYNPLTEPCPTACSYSFTKMVSIWGWATWRRTWEKYDENMSTWPAIKDTMLNDLWPDRQHREYWTKTLETMYSGAGPNTWDYQLLFKSWAENWLNIVPARNLIQNIGFGTDATHTKRVPSLSILSENITFPLLDPPQIVEWSDHPRLIQREIYNPNLLDRIKRAIRFKLKVLTSSR